MSAPTYDKKIFTAGLLLTILWTLRLIFLAAWIFWNMYRAETVWVPSQ